MSERRHKVFYLAGWQLLLLWLGPPLGSLIGGVAAFVFLWLSRP